jgi:hypothetical protein
MTNYERIKIKVQESTIDEADKQAILDQFVEVSDENLPEIADLFESKLEWVAIFNDNRKAKREAARSGDASKFKEILEQEKKYLNELTYGLD